MIYLPQHRKDQQKNAEEFTLWSWLLASLILLIVHQWLSPDEGKAVCGAWSRSSGSRGCSTWRNGNEKNEGELSRSRRHNNRMSTPICPLVLLGPAQSGLPISHAAGARCNISSPSLASFAEAASSKLSGHGYWNRAILSCRYSRGPWRVQAEV